MFRLCLGLSVKELLHKYYVSADFEYTLECLPLIKQDTLGMCVLFVHLHICISMCAGALLDVVDVYTGQFLCVQTWSGSVSEETSP